MKQWTNCAQYRTIFALEYHIHNFISYSGTSSSPPPFIQSTTRRSLFNNNRHFGVPGTVISAPSMPPSARPPAERPTSSGLPPGQTHTWTGPHNTVRPILPPALPPSPKPPAIPEPPAPPRPPPRPTIQPFTGRPSTLSGEGQVTGMCHH